MTEDQNVSREMYRSMVVASIEKLRLGEKYKSKPHTKGWSMRRFLELARASQAQIETEKAV